MLDDESSLRLNLLRFPLIVGVVYIHAYGGTVGFADASIGASDIGATATFIQNLISNGIARIAVPALFLVSGYLFFYGFVWSRDAYFAKLKGRVRTLLIPFLFWNLLILLLTALLQAFPATREYFSGKNPPIASLDLYGYLNYIFGIDRMPISYQFWFIRDLMVMILLSPIALLAPRWAFPPFIIVVAYCWLFNIWPILVPSHETVLFFSLGAWFATRRTRLFDIDRYGPAIVAAYVPLVVLGTLAMGTAYMYPTRRVGIVFGVCAMLYATRYMASNDGARRALIALSGTSFFVYAIHEPLLTLVKKIVYKFVLPHSSASIIAIYLLTPIAVIAFLVVLYRLLVAVAPRTIGTVTGGR